LVLNVTLPATRNSDIDVYVKIQYQVMFSWDSKIITKDNFSALLRSLKLRRVDTVACFNVIPCKFVNDPNYD
jgi:hypothetical protein